MTHDLGTYGFERQHVLGRGGEAVVYKALREGHEVVVKIFNDISGSERDVEAYCERVRACEAGLFPVSLIYEGSRLAGLYYDYVPLFRIPERLVQYSESLKQALLSQYCFTQSYLMRRHDLELIDRAQFLLGEDGRLYYVDYGFAIVRADNEWCRTRGYTVYSLLRVLFDPLGIELDAGLRQPGFDYSRPCEFVQPAQYETLLRRCPWTAPIVKILRTAEAKVFLDPDFYDWIAGSHSRHVPHARWLVALERCRGIANHSRRMRRFTAEPS